MRRLILTLTKKYIRFPSLDIKKLNSRGARGGYFSVKQNKKPMTAIK